jgi:hypothetical protein
MEDHRVNKRAKVDIRVAYRGDGQAYKVGRISSVSRGGVFIVTHQPPDAVGEYLTASLDVDALGKIIWAQGRVVRKTTMGMGVAFTRVDGKGLDLYLSSLGIPF